MRVYGCLCMCTNVRLRGKLCPCDSALFVFPRELELSHWLNSRMGSALASNWLLEGQSYFRVLPLPLALDGGFQTTWDKIPPSESPRVPFLSAAQLPPALSLPLPPLFRHFCSQLLPIRGSFTASSVCVFARQLVCAPRDGSKQCRQDVCHCDLSVLERPSNKEIQMARPKVAGVSRKVKPEKELMQTEGVGQVTSGVRLAEVAGMLCAKAVRCRCVWHSRRPW